MSGRADRRRRRSSPGAGRRAAGTRWSMGAATSGGRRRRRMELGSLSSMGRGVEGKTRRTTIAGGAPGKYMHTYIQQYQVGIRTAYMHRGGGSSGSEVWRWVQDAVEPLADQHVLATDSSSIPALLIHLRRYLYLPGWKTREGHPLPHTVLPLSLPTGTSRDCRASTPTPYAAPAEQSFLAVAGTSVTHRRRVSITDSTAQSV